MDRRETSHILAELARNNDRPTLRLSLVAWTEEEQENHQFHVIHCVTLACVVLYFEEFLIHNSRRSKNPLGLCHFLLNT